MEEAFNIEQAFARLEEITTQLEKPTTNLADSMKLYAEGVKLAEQCRVNLEGVEKEIQILSRKEEDD
jgi:exodeoxyribonuclease VII small subunit